MSVRLTLGGLAMAMALLSGCDQPADDQELGSLEQHGGGWTQGNPNGTGINIAEYHPENSNWGIQVGTKFWNLTHFLPPSHGLPTQAVGWYGNGSALTATQANGSITYADYPMGRTNIARYTVLLISASNTVPSITLYSPSTGSFTLTGDSLSAVGLLVSVPQPSLTSYVQYYLRINSSSDITLDPHANPANNLKGYSLTWRLYDSSAAFQPFCNNAGVAEKAMFYGSSYWDPMNATRTDNDSAVSVTCESGGISKCMSWGYAPWDTNNPGSNMKAYHNACIQAKRAAYLGDGQAFTINGTLINKYDSLMGQHFFKEDMSLLEALWTEKGASCLNDKNRRQNQLPWPGYVFALPDCGNFDANAQGWYLATALPNP